MKKIRLNQYEAAEQKRWNESLVHNPDYSFLKTPNAFIQRVLHKKRCKGKKALDVSMGQGRNTVWLAKKGFDATGFDIATEAMKLAQENAMREGVSIRTVYATDRLFSFQENQWDVVLFCYAGCLGYYDLNAVVNSLRKNGLLIFEFFHEDYGKSIGRENFGCNENEVIQPFLDDRRVSIDHFEVCEDKADYGLQQAKLIRMVIKKLK